MKFKFPLRQENLPPNIKKWLYGFCKALYGRDDYDILMYTLQNIKDYNTLYKLIEDMASLTDETDIEKIKEEAFPYVYGDVDISS